MATDLEAASLLTLKAAWLKDHKRPYGLAAAMAKRFATDAAMAAATEGLQILGGYGYLTEYPLERYFRDAKAGQIYEGTNEIMRLIIARSCCGVEIFFEGGLGESIPPPSPQTPLPSPCKRLGKGA